MSVQNIKIVYQLESSDVSELITKLAKLTKEEQDLLKAISEVEKQSQKTTQTQAQNYDNLGKIVKNVTNTILAGFAFDKVKSFTSEITKTTAEFEALQNSIKFASGSSREGANNLEFISQISKKLGLDLKTAAEGFKTIAGAALPAGISTKETQKIFESVAKATSVMGLSANDANGIFLALGQIISKGKVQAEELRGQIGERLPGAFDLAAKAMGVTTQKLNKMLEQGEVLANDFLPKFASQLDKTFNSGLAQSTNSLQANLNRMTSAFYELNVAIGSKLSSTFSFVVSGIGSMVTAFTNFINPAKTFTQTIQTEREELNLLVRKITDTTTKTEERKAILLKLQAEYPNFLKNLDAEKVSNEQLTQRLKEANQEYKNKLLLATSENALQTQAKKLQNLRNAFLDADNQIEIINNQILLKIQNDLPKTQAKQLQTIIAGVENNQIELTKKLIQIKNDPQFKNLLEDNSKLKYNIGINDKLSPNNNSSVLGGLLGDLAVFSERYENAEKEISKINDKFEKDQKRFLKAFSENNVFTDRTIPLKVATQTKEATKAEYKELEKASKEKAELALKDIQTLRKIELQKFEQQKALNDTLLQNDKLTLIDKTALVKGQFELEKGILDLKTKQELEVFEISEKNYKTHSEFKVKQKVLTENEITEINKRAKDAEILLERKNTQELAKLYSQFLEKQAQQRAANLKLKQDNLDNDIEIQLLADLQILGVSQDAYAEYQKNKSEIMRNAEQTRRDLRLAFLENELFVLSDAEVDKKREIENEITQIEKDNLKARRELAEQDYQKELEREQNRKEAIKEIRQQTEALILEIASTYYQIKANNLQKEIDDTQAQKDYDLKLAGDNAEKKAFIEKEYNTKLKSLKREQAQQEKEKAIFNALLNAGMAISRTFVDYPFPLSLGIATIVGALAAAQIVAIQSKQLPKFFDGTEFLQRGNNPTGKDTIPIFANEGERIVPTSINEKLNGVKNIDLPVLVGLGMEYNNIKQMQKFASASVIGVSQANLETELANAKAVVSELQKIQGIMKNIDLSKLPQTKVILDKDGFSEYTLQQHKETKNLNSDYSL